MPETPVLPGLMMNSQLLVSDIAIRAESVFGHREIVTRTMDGIERSTYSAIVRRARQLASALVRMGIRQGDRVASFGWNSARHLELYLAVPSVGAVLHTVNLRLHPDEIAYVIEHAQDRAVFYDASVEALLPHTENVEFEVRMPDSDERSTRPSALDYEELVDSGDPGFDFPDVDERSAAILCYTSGTTGAPKGVLYSHRSVCLNALLANQPDSFGIHEADTVMPVVPMFHANAWGLPYISAMAGSRLVLPGPSPTPRELADLVAAERVTVSAAVPTVWQGIADLAPDIELSSLRDAIAGGASVPESLIRRYSDLGVPMTQGWGMTETSPLALISRPPNEEMTESQTFALKARQGRPLPFIHTRIDGADGDELQVRGPTVAESYFRRADATVVNTEGWLQSGDVAEMDSRHFVQITDRTKDLIKSGGEWISSVDLENAILFHPAVLEAAVVAMPDARWGERPCMFVVPSSDATVDIDVVRTFLLAKFPSWSLPDRVECVTELPKTSVGKLDKKILRAHADEFADNH